MINKVQRICVKHNIEYFHGAGISKMSNRKMIRVENSFAQYLV